MCLIIFVNAKLKFRLRISHAKILQFEETSNFLHVKILTVQGSRFRHRSQLKLVYPVKIYLDPMNPQSSKFYSIFGMASHHATRNIQKKKIYVFFLFIFNPVDFLYHYILMTVMAAIPVI